MIKKFTAFAANSFMKIKFQNLRKKKGAVPEGRAPDNRCLFAFASVADERSEPDGADVLLGDSLENVRRDVADEMPVHGDALEDADHEQTDHRPLRRRELAPPLSGEVVLPRRVDQLVLDLEDRLLTILDDNDTALPPVVLDFEAEAAAHLGFLEGTGQPEPDDALEVVEVGAVALRLQNHALVTHHSAPFGCGLMPMYKLSLLQLNTSHISILRHKSQEAASATYSLNSFPPLDGITSRYGIHIKSKCS